MRKIRAKSKLLTGYLELLLQAEIDGSTIITPSDPEKRGNTLSVAIKGVSVAHVVKELESRGVLVRVLHITCFIS